MNLGWSTVVKDCPESLPTISTRDPSIVLQPEHWFGIWET